MTKQTMVVTIANNNIEAVNTLEDLNIINVDQDLTDEQIQDEFNAYGDMVFGGLSVDGEEADVKVVVIPSSTDVKKSKLSEELLKSLYGQSDSVSVAEVHLLNMSSNEKTYKRLKNAVSDLRDKFGFEVIEYNKTERNVREDAPQQIEEEDHTVRLQDNEELMDKLNTIKNTITGEVVEEVIEEVEVEENVVEEVVENKEEKKEKKSKKEKKEEVPVDTEAIITQLINDGLNEVVMNTETLDVIKEYALMEMTDEKDVINKIVIEVRALLANKKMTGDKYLSDMLTESLNTDKDVINTLNGIIKICSLGVVAYVETEGKSINSALLHRVNNHTADHIATSLMMSVLFRCHPMDLDFVSKKDMKRYTKYQSKEYGVMNKVLTNFNELIKFGYTAVTREDEIIRDVALESMMTLKGIVKDEDFDKFMEVLAMNETGGVVVDGAVA